MLSSPPCSALVILEALELQAKKWGEKAGKAEMHRADFYSHAHEDIAYLLGEVERLREAHRALLAAAEGVLADAVEEMAGEEGVA